MDEMRLKLLEGQIGLPGIGAVRKNAAGLLPYAVVDEAGREIEVFSVYLRDLVSTAMSPLTVRSYGNDLLRWWRSLELIGLPWDQAGPCGGRGHGWLNALGGESSAAGEGEPVDESADREAAAD